MKDLPSSRRIIAVLMVLMGALLLASAGGWALGFQQLWAFRFLIHIAWPVRLLLALMLLVIALFAWSTGVTVQWRVRRSAPAWMRFPPLVLVLAAALFWLLREQTYHGDALLKVELLSTHTLQTDPYVWKEPLDSLLAYTLAAWLRSIGQPPDSGVALLSVLAGVVYVAAVLRIAKVLSQTRSDFYAYSVGLLALGSSQLWFGHVENYSLVTACSFAAVALAVGYLRGRGALWSPLYSVGLAVGFAVSFHPQAVFMLPALLCLLKRSQWPRQLGVLALSGLVGPAVTLFGMMTLAVPWPDMTNGFAGDPQLFFRLAQALAPQQLADAFNNLWLVAPLAPLWIAGVLFVTRSPSVWRDAVFRYLVVVAAGLLFYHFSFQNDLPRPRDWDLFAIVGPGFTLLGLYAWLGPHTKPGAGMWLWPSLIFAVLFTLSWVGVNHVLTLIRPNPDQRDIYDRYRLLDLTTLVADATVTPTDPICTEPAASADCARVAISSFTMPQDGDMRPVIFAHAPARVVLPLHAPAERSFLWLSPALDPVAWEWGGDGVTFKVAVVYAGEEVLLWSQHLSPARISDRDWRSVFIPLDQYRGRQVELILETDPGPAGSDAGDRAGWGLPWLMRGTPDGLEE